MKIEIETYKGQTIFYDDSQDKFVCDITKEDNWKSAKRGSLVDLRNEIDQFIKKNLNFKPFKFILKERYGRTDFQVKECTAIRKDGKLSVESGVGYTSYTSVKDLDGFAMVFDQRIIDRYNELKERQKLFEDQIKKESEALCSELKPYDFSKIIEAFEEIKNG